MRFEWKTWDAWSFIRLAVLLLIAPLYWLLRPLGRRLGVWLIPLMVAIAVIVEIFTRIWSARRKRKARDHAKPDDTDLVM